MSTNVAEKTKVNTRTLVQIGMLSALAIILMQFDNLVSIRTGVL